MRIIYFGSGAFGLPTLRRLANDHEMALVVTQPDRPAGRHRVLTPTPIAEFAASRNLAVLKPEDVNEPAVIKMIHEVHADTFVVIAFGQKLSPSLLGKTFAINLHGSLLPKYRGAAPIQWAMINGEHETGVSVIGLADRMDAGPIFAQAATAIDPMETAGELHDRLAELGLEVVLKTLRQYTEHGLAAQIQDERFATKASKLSKSDGTVKFDQPSIKVRNRIHGLTPWPGCTVRIDGRVVRLARVQATDDKSQHECPGMVLEGLLIACSTGSIRVLDVQPPGGTVMPFDAYRHGHPIAVGMKCEPL